MNYVSISGLITSFCGVICSLFIFFSSPRTNIKKVWSIYSLAMGLWGFGLFMSFSSSSPEGALFWAKFLNTSAIPIPVLFFYFVLLLTNKDCEHKKELIIYILISSVLLFLAIIFNDHFVKNVDSKMNFEFYPTSGFLYYFFPIQFGYLVVRTILILIKEFTKSTGLRNEQLKYVLIGSVIGFSGGGTTFPLVFDIEVYPFGIIQVPIYLSIITYAVIKYRLMDIQLAITRAGIFVFVYTLVLGIPFGVTAIGRNWLIENLGPNWYWTPMLVLVLLATVGPFIYIYLQNKAENSLLQEQKAYQQILRQASYGIGKIKKLDTLVKLIDRVLIRSAGIERCAIYLIDKEEESPVFNLTKIADSLPQRITIPPDVLTALKRFSEPFIIEELVYHNPDNVDVKQMVEFLRPFQAEIVVPIVQSEKLLSLILLGKKKDHSLYTNDDLTVFTILASQAGLAMENCLFIEAEKERLEREGASTRRESLDMLVSTMAHEIDNPIQGAIGQAEMLKICLDFFRHHLPKETMDEVKQYCEKIESNCMRVSKIVKAVENYSKRETGHLKLVELQDVITPFHSLVLMIRKKYKEVKYTEDIEEILPSVWGEEIMIEEILMNLVENAYHAVIHNEGEKKVHLHIFKKDDDYIRINVKDNGYGITPKVKNQLFQVPTTTKGSSQGTGLGLYRIRQICEILKAKYGAESEGRGKGALFYIELPIHKPSKHKEPADGK